jgi:hypothetical protein
MTDPKLHEVATKLGQFYLNKNGGDYAKATDEIYRLHIKSIVIAEDDAVIITAGRLGLLIGKRGTNIDAISKFFNGRVFKLIEDTESILDLVIPRKLDDFY